MKTCIIRGAGWIWMSILAPAAMAATFTVTNTNDSGVGSLRDAINLANNDPVSPVQIHFNAPTGPGGIAVIQPLTPLPIIQNIHGNGITIDGFTQPGATKGVNPPSTLVIKVELDGSLIAVPPPPPVPPQDAHGLHIKSSSNKVQGLCIHSFPQDGISIQGIPLSQTGPSGANANYIQWNLVGTDVTGIAAKPNGHALGGLWGGIYIKVLPGSPGVANQNQILENVVSGNNIEGVGIANCPDEGDVQLNHVERCYVGIDITGTGPLGNGHDGIYIGEGAHDNMIEQNHIGANGYEGIGIVGYGPAEWHTYGNHLLRNKIGVDVNLNPMPNKRHGVAIGSYGGTVWGFAPKNKVEQNIIAYNQLAGVAVDEAAPLGDDETSGNTITANAIYFNGMTDPGHLGIDLAHEPTIPRPPGGVTANDLGDPDQGPNGLMNFPVINSAIHNAGATTVSGTIDPPGYPVVIELFQAITGNYSNHGQGAVYLGTTSATGPGPSWSLVLTGSGLPGQLLTATATDASGNTSEFSLNSPVWDANQQEVDFGDAPDDPQNPGDYPTLLASNGARHQIVPGMYLGNSVDGEADGQPNATATGDDNDGNDDGDGVTFPVPLIPGQQAQIDVVASVLGRLDAWLDFDANGTWAPSEQILSSAIHPGGGMLISYSFSVPIGAAVGNTFARIRYSSGGGLLPTGLASDGEVEDHMVSIQQGQPQQFDWSDAPDQPYPTLAASNGARHLIVQGVYLGNIVDAEANGQPHPQAAGDDNTMLPGTDDEDGVIFLSPIVVGGTATVQVTASVQGDLYGWLDFNRNGTWADPGEMVFGPVNISAGVSSLSFSVPPGAVPGTSFARFRFTTAVGIGLPFSGPAPDGEVEDYILEIEDGSIVHKMHWAQLPDPNGWDVRGYVPKILADDFRCTESGPITQIIFWGSWRQDVVGQIQNVHLSIHEDDRSGEFSKPGKLLWEADTAAGLVEFQPDPEPQTGDQGWYDPNTQLTIPQDHRLYFRYTVNIPENQAFVQEEGKIYWLDIQVNCVGGEWGWKTSRAAHFEDDAVWDDTPQDPTLWRELVDPIEQLSLDLAFVIGSPEEQVDTDYGDAPDQPYPTLAASNGARHLIVPGFRMGANIDPEPNGQPTAPADGDDLNPLPGPNDEDGVYFYPLVIGQQGAIDVSVSASGFIDAWIDFNNNGSWLDPGEKIANSVAVSAGLNQIAFNLPAGTVVSSTYARIRYSSTGGLAPTGAAQDGEVEDYQVKILPEGELIHDFGDAPPQYPTLAANNGARHQLGGPLWLGATVDPEPDGQPHPAALGDDQNLVYPGLPDDEDGVSFSYALISGKSSMMQVTASAAGFIDVWIDWNGNSSWADAGDNVLSHQAVNPGANYIMISVPTISFTGFTKARVRISSTGYLLPTGFAKDGEVEDHDVLVYQESGMDFGDAPDQSISPSSSYETTMANLGAAHFIDSLFLGWLIDAEMDGQPSLGATADNTTGMPDEDGVAFTSPWISGVTAQLNVKVTAPTPGPFNLDLWVDWNGDGTWAQANEYVIVALPVMAGLNPVAVPVPSGLGPVKTYARFRLSHPGTVTGYTGYVFGGEVEDYRIPIGKRIQAAITVNRSVSPAKAVLTWPAEPGATSYSVYSSTNLGGGFPNAPNWTFETNTGSLTWSQDINATRKFFVVVAFP